MFNPPSLPALDIALRGALLALLSLLALRLWRDRPQLPAARLGAVFMLGLCVQVVSSHPWLEANLPCHWQSPLIGVSVGNAVLFWVFVKALFDDDFCWRPLYLWVWLAAVLLAVVNCNLAGPDAPAWTAVTRAMQRVLPLVCTVLAGVAAAQQWRADLVEKRRRLRVFILATGAVYTVAQVAMRWGSPRGLLSAPAASADVLMLLLMVAVSASQVLKLSSQELFPSQPRLKQAEPLPLAQETVPPAESSTGPGAPDAAEERLMQALSMLMKDRQGYREEDLTVATLAFKLSVPEYRLRRVINQRLGYRNFNAYINGWRLADARAALADPARREVPVLTIALDAGFQSIGPFNRAFKADTGQTPTEYRRQQLADS
jgi:AraC-like DNA-binding protein